MPFKLYKQLNVMDCGPTCLRMVAKYYGKHFSAETLRDLTGFSKNGISLYSISDTAEKLGFRTRGVTIGYDKLLRAPVPAILHWDQKHFVVVIRLSKNHAVVADPEKGIIRYHREEFLMHWAFTGTTDDPYKGTALLLEPTAAFHHSQAEKENRLSWHIVTQYLYGSKWQVAQIFLSLGIGSLLQLALPFLTQSMVDTGINTRNMQYIVMVLIAQLTLTFSTTVVTFIRSRLQLHVSNRINISLLSDFWIKITRLPLSYFDTHHTGDTIQRIEDNRKIQSFLTGDAVSSVFSILNFIVYAILLMFYSIPIFLIFVAGNSLYYLWIRMFLPFRRKINNETFYFSTRENNSTLQLIQGMQEIRLNNAEKLKRWEWEDIQANIFRLNFKNLNYNQWQSSGATFITQSKDILISFIVAKLVVEGQLTFGAMLAVQYVVGQLSGPVLQFISFTQNLQDARISMERLNEVHNVRDEEPREAVLKLSLPTARTITLKNLFFSYPNASDEPTLRSIDLSIEEGKVTAVVGASGSGKTTLMKLILRVYDNYHGEIRIGKTPLRAISPAYWRSCCGAVLQDGYIFNDTIARNIVVGDEFIDREKLERSCHIANILSFIDSLPNGFNTRLGSDGISVSQGQRQRLLIARAIYKDPEYILFDEATNALDADNEKIIVENLKEFFKGRTVLVIAHRLSTVKNADKIIVLHEGRIEEEGSHKQLTALQGRYYSLVKNQLELGA